jgi:DNA repair protein RadD
VAYNAPIRRLIEEGFLCRLTTEPASGTVDTGTLHMRGGEFVQLEAENLFCKIVEQACKEIVSKCRDRRHVLVFTQGVRHAEQVVACLERLTKERVGLVTGDTYPMLRAATLEDFRSGCLRWCVNVDVLTTGFDAPNIDAIAILRATMSPGLFAQIVGRGFRIATGKVDCLVLDFGGNIRRHGPIDAPDYGVEDHRQRVAGEAPTKDCPNCETETLIGTAECAECGFAFPQQVINHDTKADEAKILAEPITLPVVTVSYSVHRKRNKPDATPTMRVDYECERKAGDLLTISEWVCIEHEGYAQKKAVAWWLARSTDRFPLNCDEAVASGRAGRLASAHHITAIQEGRFWRISRCELDERPEITVGDAEFNPFSDSVEEVAF